MFDRLAAKSQSSVEKVTVKNVMNPLLWICGLVALPSLGVIFWSNGNVSWVVEFLAMAPPTASIIFYAFFAFVSPDRLQSEGYQLKKQVIELIEEKGAIGPIDARGLQVISNPDLVRLENYPLHEKEEIVIDKGPE